MERGPLAPSLTRRAPVLTLVGNEGTIVDILRTPDGSVCYVVECVDRGNWRDDMAERLGLSLDEVEPT
jgi:hypothetical protein